MVLSYDVCVFAFFIDNELLKVLPPGGNIVDYFFSKA